MNFERLLVYNRINKLEKESPMTKIVFIFSALLGFNLAQAANHPALKYVPGGEIVVEKKDEVKVKTPKGGIVEVEFKRNGDFEEASGKNASQDVFQPPFDLVPLSKAVKGLKDAKKEASGEWSLDSSYSKGWHYEFEAYEDGKEVEYLVDAKNGKFLKSKVD